MAEKQRPILSIVPAPLIPPVSGGQKHTYGLLDALGKEIDVISITDTHSSTMGHSFQLLPLMEHNLKKYLSFGNFKLILKMTRQLNPAAILLEQPYMGLIVYIVSRKTNVPFFIHAHNIEFLRFKSLGKWWWPLLFLWEKFAFTKAKAVFFISEEDHRLAIHHFKLVPTKCHVSPYGVPQKSPIIAVNEAVTEVKARHQILPDDKVFMFFGVLKYLPNIAALEIIINEIRPRLKKKLKSGYKILICGGGLSEEYISELKKFESDQLVYAGFVHDIDEYTQSADVVLNPILSGGGVKTKVIEALGFDKTVVSTVTGALGINPTVCGNKLQIVPDDDWDLFVDKMITSLNVTDPIPQEFFDTYSWESIAQNVKKVMIKG